MNIQEEMTLLMRGCEEVISPEDLEKKLKLAREENRPLRIKAGFDPSSPDIHLGHSVLLRKLKHFQTCGHEVYFLIGDFTGRIGDPTGKSQLRKQLTIEEVNQNAETYKQQVFKILDPDQTKVVFNSEWCAGMSFADVIDLTSKYTVARMLERDDFSKRFKGNQSISILEFLYPLIQGYDSVHLKADIELGGTDQKFNLLMGRHLQREYSQKEQQVVMMMPILEGLDGQQKMSKSLNNYISINDKPQEMFGKLMSLSDNLMFRYYELLTDISLDEIEDMKQEIYREILHPKVVKVNLAKSILSSYYGDEQAEECAVEFDKIFKNKKAPTDMESYKLSKNPVWIVQFLVDSGLLSSKSEARRMIQQGAVKLNDEKVTNIDSEIFVQDNAVLQVGKRRFRRIIC